jgi:trigger factor
MQVTETLAEGLKREFKVVVPAAELEEKTSGRLAEIARQANLPGFRPGKVPVAILRQRYGESVRAEILQQTIADSWQEALEDKGLRPALQPKIEMVNFAEGTDLEYKMAVELVPDIGSPDFGQIELEKPVADVPDDEIEAAVKRLADSRKTFEAADAAHIAVVGDRVRIDFTGRVDGNEFPGGTGKDFPLELGSGMFLPGFSDQLEGAKAGETREVKVSFPEGYGVKDLAGKEAVFTVEVKAVETPVAAALDDAFAKSYGAESLDALRTQVRGEIERQYAQLTRARLKRSLLDVLADKVTFELPAGLVEHEFESIWQQVKQAIEEGKLDDDDKDKSEEELRDQYRKIAERRVKLGLLLAEVGRANNIQVSQDDLNRAMAEEARRYPGQERRVLEFFRENPQASQELQAPIYEDKVVDFILELAKVAERKVPIAELMRDPDAPASADAESFK